MIEKIIADSKASEDEAITDEREAQSNYETFVSDSNTAIANLESEVVAKTDQSAAAMSEKEQANSDLSNTEIELTNLGNYRANLHGECDFLLKNFDIRRKARQLEIDAIGQAKAILSGAQKKRKKENVHSKKQND